MAASTVDNFYYVIHSEAKRLRELNGEEWTDRAKKEVEDLFYNFMGKVSIYTIGPKSIRKALSKKGDIEDEIIYTNFKRIAPKGVVISSDKGFRKYPDVISPAEFLEKYKNTGYHLSSIPLLDLQKEYKYMLEDIDHAILNTVAEARYILGPQVKELEDKIAEYLNVKHCIGICSGTDALVLSLRALAIKIKGEEYWDRDDLIITTPFTFTATGDAILRAGATPLFVDIDPNTYNIDPARIKEYLTQNSQLRTHNSTHVVGVVPVHLYGQSCQMDEIMDIANEYNLFVLEDVAQAFGGMWKEKKLGSIGTAGIFSFFPSKNLGGFGDGGMVSTNADEIAELVRMLLRHGGKDKYNVDHIEYNARLDTLQAAIILAKFKYVDEFNEHRRKIAEIYTRELASIEGLFLPVNNSTSQLLNFSTSKLPDGHAYHQYTIRVLRNKRDELKERLQRKGISTAIYYPLPLHKMKVFHKRCRLIGDLAEAEKAVKEVLSLPVEPLLTEKEITHVCEIIKEIMTNDKAQILNKVQMTKLKW
ncbi:DegT/DnrJ/EryC1/StrS family aminotransferase [Thermodesulfovibrionales bacterium]|nr:DegT/DnrJ/EryC1/StrS family aminotransferase [Thermodesulfovibrionales bacterium]